MIIATDFLNSISINIIYRSRKSPFSTFSSLTRLDSGFGFVLFMLEYGFGSLFCGNSDFICFRGYIWPFFALGTMAWLKIFCSFLVMVKLICLNYTAHKHSICLFETTTATFYDIFEGFCFISIISIKEKFDAGQNGGCVMESGSKNSCLPRQSLRIRFTRSGIGPSNQNPTKKTDLYPTP